MGVRARIVKVSRLPRLSRMVLRFVESAHESLRFSRLSSRDDSRGNSGFCCHATSLRDCPAGFSRTSPTRCTIDQPTIDVGSSSMLLLLIFIISSSPRSIPRFGQANRQDDVLRSRGGAERRAGESISPVSGNHTHAPSFFTASRVGARRPMVQRGLYDARLRPFFHSRCKRVAPSGDSNINRAIDDHGR